MRIVATVLALVATAATASARPAHLRWVGDDVRFALERSAAESDGPVTRRLQERGGTVGSSTDPMALDCDRSSAIFWESAARWISENTEEAKPRGSIATFELITERNNLRGMVVRSENAIAAAPRHEFLLPNERITAAPADRATDLRQRAEWTVFLSSMFRDMSTAQASDPRDFGKAYGISLWTRAYCGISKSNLDAAHAAFTEVGYPDTARFGDATENAFILLVRASGDRELAQSALVAAGDKASPAARRVLGAMTPAPAEPTPQ